MKFILVILLCLFAFTTRTAIAQMTIPQLEAELKKKPSSLRLRTELANRQAKEGRHDKVIELLNPYTDQLDNNGFLILASSYSAKKDYASEVRVLSILTAKEDDNFQWHMLLGQAHIKRAQEIQSAEPHADALTAGVQELRRTLQLNKKFKPAFDLLLNTFLNERQNNEARELIAEGINKYGDRPELYRELCRLDSSDGFLVQAIEHCRESIKLSPNFPDHYVYLVQTLHDQKEEVQAERTITTAAKRFPNSEFVQWAAGTVFLRKKNFPVAARYFEAATQANPKQARSQYGLAQALFESGSEEAALSHFVAACKGEPQSVETFLAAGGRLKQKGKMELGGKYIQAASTCRY